MGEQFCNLPASLLGVGQGRLCQWPRGMVVHWYIRNQVPGINNQAELTEEIFDRTSLLCNIKFQHTAVSQNANILFDVRRIDGTHGTLAQAYLPCGRVNVESQMLVEFDVSERWGVFVNPNGGNQVDFYRVAWHEILHALGVGHEQTRSIRALMDPTVSEIREPQDWDIDQLIQRYGPPVKPVPPKPDPQPPKPEPDNSKMIEALNNIKGAIDTAVLAINKVEQAIRGES